MSHENIDDIFIEDEDGYLHDFDIAIQEETFDGFDEVFPESIKLKIK